MKGARWLSPLRALARLSADRRAIRRTAEPAQLSASTMSMTNTSVSPPPIPADGTPLAP